MGRQFLFKAFKRAGQGNLVSGSAQMIESGSQEAMGGKVNCGYVKSPQAHSGLFGHWQAKPVGILRDEVCRVVLAACFHSPHCDGIARRGGPRTE
jgi:hypothetical protein